MITNWVYANFEQVKPAANDLMVCCPFCAHDTKFHMGIRLDKPMVNCFKCGWSGSWWSLIKEVCGTESWAEAYHQLHQPAGIRDFETVVARLRERKADRKVLSDMPEWYEAFAGMSTKYIVAEFPQQAKLVLKYAYKRLSWENIVKHSIGWCANVNHPCALRMVIPIERGYYQARAINGHTARKYLNPDFPIEDRLFNYQALEQHSHVYICEGAISAIAVGDNAVATLGANGATLGQRKRLVRSKVDKFTLVVEPEQVAIDKAVALGTFLQDYGKDVWIRQYKEGDPADSELFEEFSFGVAFRLKF